MSVELVKLSYWVSEKSRVSGKKKELRISTVLLVDPVARELTNDDEISYCDSQSDLDKSDFSDGLEWA
jgi:hypothetical protein